jgi:DNA polymerase III delta prime subunit
MIKLLPSHSYLLISDTINSEIINYVEPIDLQMIDANNTPVKQLRESLFLASQSPLGGQRLLIVTSADELSDIMQNTLLKVLEEPPEHLTIILQTKLPGQLLPTVRSRLSKLDLVEGDTSDTGEKNEIELNTLTKAKDRVAFKETLKKMQITIKKALQQNPVEEDFIKLSLLEKASNRLSQNCNQKIIYDSLLLHWPESSGKQIPGDRN